MLQKIELETALNILDEKIIDIETEEVSLMDAQNRVLAKDIFSPINHPPFDRSPLDGFALIAEDTKGASGDTQIELEIIEEVYAGSYPQKKLSRGTVTRIMTGAPIPRNADCVIRQEETLVDGQTVKILKELKKWDNYCFKGEDFQKGQLILERERMLKSPEIGVLACLGVSKVSVYKKPKIAILSTGDELVGVEDELSDGKIYNSNLYAIASRIKELGGEPIILGVAGDDIEIMCERIKQEIDGVDLFITTGGVSVGKKDIVKDVMYRCGANILFWRVNIKPGSPVLCSELQGKLVISLSGNPSAAMISFELLARPIINNISHRTDLTLVRDKAVLEEDFSKKSPVRRFLRGKMTNTSKGKSVILTKNMQTSSKMNCILNSNCLIDVPKDSPSLESGQIVEIVMI
ncbi:molybdopterin molybdotransferase MoeA [Wukongibacter baidiensis]|uniref:molybdopterin molybdotransferase MoeA n=1 Tax=Wukongibacter baidiensis TaxID=1723361 RepID=UPI003D7FCA37